jgi:hypothetical protein
MQRGSGRGGTAWGAVGAAALAGLVGATLGAGAAQAEAAALREPGGLSLRFDGVEPVAGACRLTFVVWNGLEAGLARLDVEAVAFDAGGGVLQLAMLELGPVPQGRLRVRQFDLPGLACADLGAVLVNGVERCEAEGPETALAPDACAARLTLGARDGLELL